MMYLKAFLIGGLICAFAQILIDHTKLTPARILVGYVCGGVILSGFGIYEKLVDFAGCGATVPLTGFGHCLAVSVAESINESGFIGILSGPLTGAAVGLGTAIFFGFILALLFNSKPL
ncbi:MAG: stage V sporulation protein AE [Ruminococcaceae bacterium]|nr:stage V sporulation protein AE [Oscillospiraceae bacterium]